ncbi:TIGR03621 family F420-dependent LLM class oxidoreductase [Kineosporia sp. R_H_3]|uniref:TIGR03621 family F420-dependent LLM class oxidoreductase n=1 Tax=Kineosporia sp. R_H_3 TaxID=1961848 RepID=UPI000B4AA217|nr:TIGR03621 family F420-dependent LLM class oxidoreductase [Kineosporia sp. R_H_3]
MTDPATSATPLPLFGVNLGRLADPASGPAPAGPPGDDPAGVPAGPVAAARWAEENGLDVVTAADHVGAPSPFLQLAAAAAVTSRVRLRTYVLDYGFWNPVLLARDVATLDVVSGGRVDLGLGAGHMPKEHERAGLPFPRYADRLAELDAFAAAVRDALAADDQAPKPVQQPVPLFIAAMSPRGLDVAARHGSVVGLAGAVQLAGRPAGTFGLASSAQTDERVAEVRAARAARGQQPATFDVLLQMVSIGQDPTERAEALAAEWAAEGDDITAAELLDTPFLLFARTAEDAAAELERRTARWGVSSWCTHTPSGVPLAQVAAAYRARAAAGAPA